MLKVSDSLAPLLISSSKWSNWLVHFGEYALLCFLWWRALASVTNPRRAALLAFVIASAYALTDEYHQTFVDAVRATGGRVEAVDDQEVVEAIGLLARTTGVFGETAAGVTIATVARLATAGAFRPGETVVALVTGHGLKTREVLDGRAAATVTVRPNIDALEEALAPIRPGLTADG